MSVNIRQLRRDAEIVSSTWKSKTSLASVAQRLYEELNTPTSLGLWLCLRYNDTHSLVSHKIQYGSYTDGRLDVVANRDQRHLQKDLQAIAFVKKNPFIGSFDTAAAASEAFRRSEASCAATNARIAEYERTGVSSPVINRILHTASRYIARTLGDFDPREWFSSCRFGPGVSFDSPSTLSYDKLADVACVNPQAFRLAACLTDSSPSWHASIHGYSALFEDEFIRPDLSTVHRRSDAGRQAFVPKTSLTDRAIEIQPLLSVYMQMGIGSMIRARLRRSGLNLNTQAKNRRLAFVGSLYDTFVTIDLEAASDTVSRRLVQHLLPERWYHAMCLCRPDYLLVEGRRYETERFASMGNGYTFELESLIFWSLLIASSEEAVGGLDGYDEDAVVHGDDIVCSKATAAVLIPALEWCGFSVNLEKTFLSGPFRESCGYDYFIGTDVRPLFQKEDVRSVETLIRLCNRVRRHAARLGSYTYRDKGLYGFWRYCQSLLPPLIRTHFRGPEEESDRWIQCDFDDYAASPLYRYRVANGYSESQLLSIERAVHRRGSVQAQVAFSDLLYRREMMPTVAPDALSFRVSEAKGSEYILPTYRVKTTVKANTDWVYDPTASVLLWM